ncbi:hypothetical protein CRG98_014381 [Punica granatum]|uniref:Uncharacterized protein n=1 Tax=Punica granatum TaxID=22663 RepID=A0A2I0K9L0_PUNGR|nr:hypothetical protein CRG98_014381 [Punica granatum]
MTRELDRSYGYQESHMALSPSVYLVPLDPGNLPVLDFQVVKWQVVTPSHVRPLRVPGKVYLVPLDPGNLPVLDFQVVKWQVVTPSHMRPLRVPGKVDTPKPRCISTGTRTSTR